MPEKVNYNPDILSCLANLSSDEVFTPPEIANAMLDMLPQELFRSPDTKFLDPGCKSGVFLREIAKRLIEGLKDQIPDLEQRLDHIYKKQLFAIAITQITSLLSRRSVYCSKNASSKFSVARFDDSAGNIRFRRIEHIWVDGRCAICGASQEVQDRGEELESHAYEFIHINDKEFKELKDMKFDVIIGNPPYQLNIGVEKENYAVPIYQKFVEQAKKLNPRYLSMIIPARWYAGGRGLDDFRDDMLHDNHLRILHDYPNSAECFPAVDLSGGACYFLWDRENVGDCTVFTHEAGTVKPPVTRPLLEPGCETFIRQNEAISILRKVRSFGEKSFMPLVGPQTPFGLVSSFRDFKEEKFPGSVKYYTYGFRGYITQDQVLKNKQWIKQPKVYISKAYGERGPYPYFFLGKPFFGEANSCCSQSYLIVGPFDNESICSNVITYMATRFFRSLVMLRKNTQDNMNHVFGLVPVQDFTKPWSDEELYKKYGLSSDEISFIESMVKPMDVGGADA